MSIVPLRIAAFPLALALSLTASRPAVANDIFGRVIDAESGEPVSGALVKLLDTSHDALTDEDGRFLLRDVEPGEYTLEVSQLGYSAQTGRIEVPEGSNVRLRIAVAPAVIELEPIEVAVRSAKLESVGFYRRMQSGIGTFITRADLEAESVARLSDYVTRVAGLRRTELRDGSYRLNMRGRQTIITDCRTQYFIDGIQAEMVAYGIDEVAPDAVEGIEIYKGASQLPSQFSVGRAMCGAILIWTRAGGSGRS